MSLEEQKSKLAAARAKAQGTLARGDSGEPGLGSSQCAAGVRGTSLGCDRDGLCYWKLQSAEAFGGANHTFKASQIQGYTECKISEAGRNTGVLKPAVASCSKVL